MKCDLSFLDSLLVWNHFWSTFGLKPLSVSDERGSAKPWGLVGMGYESMGEGHKILTPEQPTLISVGQGSLKDEKKTNIEHTFCSNIIE